MKHVLKFAVALLVLAVIGCGGSGNGTPSTLGTVTNQNVRLEAIIQVLPTNLMHPSMWTPAQLLNPQTPGLQADLIDPTVFGVMDPLNIECGQQIVFQLVYYTISSTGSLVRNIVPNATFQSSDATGAYGTLALNTGDYLAGGTATPQALSISGSANGITYSAFYGIKIDQVQVLGSVLAQGTNANQLAGSQVQFYNSAGALVDTVTVQYDGSIRASVPNLTTSFTVVADSLPQGFYQSFGYEGLQYDAGLVGCFAPLTLPNGITSGTITLPGTILVAPRVTGQGTPPATGCSDSGKVRVIGKR